MLRRLYLILDKEDQSKYHLLFQSYQVGGEHFVYGVPSDETTIELNNLAIAYYTAYSNLRDQYGSHPMFQVFERVYNEHFTRETSADKITITLRSTEELGSDTLQSPDDLEATFRNKRGEDHHGFVALGIETCHPDNEVNLVTVLDVDTNNTDDSILLENKMEELVERCPEVKEIHLDGGFGSEEIDAKAKKEGLTIIQTAVRGRTAKVAISVQGDEEKGFLVDCPNSKQLSITASKTKKNYKATFDLTICQQCPFRFDCPAYKNKSEAKQIATFYFAAKMALMQKRHKAIQTIPKERRTIRAGVEGLMGQMHQEARHTGKLKIRGLFKCKLYVFAMVIAINFKRIYSWLVPKNGTFSTFFTFLNSYLFTEVLSVKKY